MNFSIKRLTLILRTFAALMLFSSAWVGAAETQSHSPTKPKSTNSKTKKGSRSREKEAEGTEAANRFAEDPVIKSQYRQGGEPLEVDPD